MKLLLHKVYNFFLLPFIFFITFFSSYFLEFPIFIGLFILILSSVIVFLSYSNHIYLKFSLYILLLIIFYFLNFMESFDIIYNAILIIIPSFLISLVSYKSKSYINNSNLLLYLLVYASLVIIIICCYLSYKKNINIYNTLYDYAKFIIISINTKDNMLSIPENTFKFIPFLIVQVFVYVWVGFIKFVYIIYNYYNYNIIKYGNNTMYLSKYHDFILITTGILAILSNKFLDIYNNFVYTIYAIFMVFLIPYAFLVIRYCTNKSFNHLAILFLISISLDIIFDNLIINLGFLSISGFLVNLKVIK